MGLGAVPARKLAGLPLRETFHGADGEALQAMRDLITLAVDYLLRAEACRILLDAEGNELPKQVRRSVSKRIRESERLAVVTLIQREAVQEAISGRHPEAQMN